MSVTRGFLVSLLLCLLGAAVVLAQPVGPEFRVNTYTTDDQKDPSVAADSSGNFVVVWQFVSGGHGFGIFGQRYASSGTPLGTEFQVNTYNPTYTGVPSVAADSSGNFVVVWPDAQEGSLFGIYGRRYDSSGAPLGPEFLVNTYTTADQRYPSVAADTSGGFAVVWSSNGQDGSFNGVFGQRYASTGVPLGPEFLVNTYTTYFQERPSVATDASGNFVVVWQSSGGSYPQDGSGSGVFGQRYASSGTPLGTEFRVNTYTTYAQRDPSVTSDPSGNFVVVWESADQDGSDYGVFGQRYASSGAPLGPEFRVNTYTTNNQDDPSVTADSFGNFVVVWESAGKDGSDYGVFGQRYDSSGTPSGPEFRVNTYTTSNQDDPSVTADSFGNLVVVWESAGQDGSIDGVFGQRYSAACAASVQVKGDVHTPGSTLRVRIHIAHNRPETVTVPWGLSLIDPSGRVVAERVWAPHTFEPGDVVDVKVALPLPKDLEGGTYTLRLGVNGMAGTEGATTTFQVMRAE